MEWAVWLSFATVSAVNIVTPGPANLNTVRRAIQLGGWRVAPTILGNALGLAVGGVFCAAGISSFVMASGFLWLFFQGAGVAYLAWLGIKLLTKREKLSFGKAVDETIGAGSLFSEAFLLAVTNPKALLFYMALFPQVLDTERDLALQTGALIVTYCGLSIVSLSTYSTLANLFRAQFVTQAIYDRFRQVSGVILVGFAIKLLVELG